MAIIMLSVICLAGFIIQLIGSTKKVKEVKILSKVLQLIGWIVMIVCCILLLLIKFEVIKF